ncbi:MAG: ATP-binding cassette domain-containing protein, partial [Nitrososphaerales archaeon]
MKIILSLPRRVTKRQQQLFKANVEFKTKSKITKRTLAVSEAFGIGVDDEKTFPVFRNFELDLKRGNVLLITGDSGSGKSTLLREISEQV